MENIQGGGMEDDKWSALFYSVLVVCVTIITLAVMGKI